MTSINGFDIIGPIDDDDDDNDSVHEALIEEIRLLREEVKKPKKEGISALNIIGALAFFLLCILLYYI